jgi:thymidylate synthase (FAD)
MTVTLIHKTDDGDNRIAYIARVSSGNQDNPETAPRLISYLIKHGHWSPFEMVSVAFEIVTTRDIGRQILRHRSFSFQEFSQRYAEVQDMNIDRELRFKGTTNRQGSRPAATQQEIEVAAEYGGLLVDHAKMALRLYSSMLKAGIAPECARAVLPEGLTPTRLYMHGTLRSWIHFLKERLKRNEHGVRLAQKECADIALLIYGHLAMAFPNVFAAIDDLNYLELEQQERLMSL